MKVVYMLTSNPNGIDLTWYYVSEHWDDVVTKFGGGHLFSRFISPFSKFKTTDKATEIKKFFDKNKAEGIDRTVAQTTEKIKANADFIKRDAKKIEAYLKA